MRGRLSRAGVTLFDASASTWGSWNAPVGGVGCEEIQISLLDEDGSELLTIDGLIRVGSRIACVAEPVLSESDGECGADAALLLDVQSPVVVGGQAAPARIRLRTSSAEG